MGQWHQADKGVAAFKAQRYILMSEEARKSEWCGELWGVQSAECSFYSSEIFTYFTEHLQLLDSW